MSGPRKKSSDNIAAPDLDNNLGRGAPADREERIRQRARNIQQEGRPERQAQDNWDRSAVDLDRENAAIQREEIAGEKPGVRTAPKPKTKRRIADKA